MFGITFDTYYDITTLKYTFETFARQSKNYVDILMSNIDPKSYVTLIKKVEKVSELYGDYTEEEKQAQRKHWA